MTTLTKRDIIQLIDGIPSDQVRDELALDDPLIWFTKNIRTEKGVPVEFIKRPYLVQMICDFHPKQRWKKAAQTGGTHSAIGKVLYACDVTSTLSLQKDKKSKFAVPITVIYCVDEETELLSKRGWLKYNELKDDDEILTLQKKYMKSRWSNIKEIFRKEVSMEMSNISTSRFSALVTPNHRWIVQDYGKGKSYFVETKDLFNKTTRQIPTSVKCSSLPSKSVFSDDFVKLVGWVITEGYYAKSEAYAGVGNGRPLTRMSISQSEKVNSKHCKEIRKILKNLNIDYIDQVPYSVDAANNFTFTEHVALQIRKLFPYKELTNDFILSLTSHQLNLLIATMIKGDGWHTAKVTAFTQKSKQTTDAFSLACILAGYSITVKQRTHAEDNCYTVTIKKNSHVWVNELHSEKVSYKGIIWCPRTEDGTFLAKRENTIYWTGNTFPTKQDVMEFSKARFTTIIRDSPHLSTMIKDYDSAGLKQVGESTLYFKGTFADKQALSVPSDLNVHDELDFSNPNVRTTYSNRLDASEFDWRGKRQNGWTWDFSTPTLPDYGIDRLYKESDRMVWLVKCTVCNLWQTINFFKNVLTMKKKKGEHYYGCRKCSGRLDRKIGRWRAKNPNSRFRGYYVSQMMSGVVPAQRLVDTYNEAPLKPNGMKNFHNFNLGLAYEVGENIITKDLIKKHIIAGTVTPGDIYLGADQGDVIHIEITKIVDGKRHIIEIAKVHSFDDLEQIIKVYKPKISVIDALPNHHPAMDLANKYPNVFLCFYNGDSLNKEDYFNKDNKEINIPRTDVLDHTAALWKMDQVLIESYISPIMIDEFVVQMTNMKRDLEDDKKTQEQKAIWKRVGPDHFRHADVYNWIASDIGSGVYSDLVLSSEPDANYSMKENVFDEEEQW